MGSQNALLRVKMGTILMLPEDEFKAISLPKISVDTYAKTRPGHQWYNPYVKFM